MKGPSTSIIKAHAHMSILLGPGILVGPGIMRMAAESENASRTGTGVNKSPNRRVSVEIHADRAFDVKSVVARQL